MNILFVSTDSIPHIGGKSTHILDLCDGLEKINNNTYILSANDYPSLIFWAYTITLLPLKFINKNTYTKITYNIYQLIQSINIKKYVKKYRIDLISAQDVYAAKLSKRALVDKSIPIVLTMHTYFAIEPTLDNGKIKINSIESNKLFLSEIEALDCIDSVIAVDSRIKEHVQDTIYNYRRNSCLIVHSILNFTNIDRFKPVTEDVRDSLRLKYKIDPDRFIIICSRRLVEKNGVIYAVKAMKDLPNESNSHLLIVGEGPQKNEILKYIEKNHIGNRITLLGEMDNKMMHEIYQISNVSCVPSITINGLQEASSVSAIEAMGCGVPVIASKIGGLKEIIKNGYNGYLVHEMDARGIQEKILLLEMDHSKCMSMRKNAIDYIRENHSNISAAKKYFEIFNKIKPSIIS